MNKSCGNIDYLLKGMQEIVHWILNLPAARRKGCSTLLRRTAVLKLEYSDLGAGKNGIMEGSKLDQPSHLYQTSSLRTPGDAGQTNNGPESES